MAGESNHASATVGGAYCYAKGLFDCRNIRTPELQAMDRLVEALARATFLRLGVEVYDVGRP